jgi:hypothetical protein
MAHTYGIVVIDLPYVQAWQLQTMFIVSVSYFESPSLTELRRRKNGDFKFSYS